MVINRYNNTFKILFPPNRINHRLKILPNVKHELIIISCPIDPEKDYLISSMLYYGGQEYYSFNSGDFIMMDDRVIRYSNSAYKAFLLSCNCDLW